MTPRTLTRKRAEPRRSLFKIAHHVGPGGNVVLNCVGGPRCQLAAVGKQYHRAARTLAKAHIRKPHYHDLEAYPIVFNYRHALELALKSLAGIGNLMTHVHHGQSLRTKNTYGDHQLSRFLPTDRSMCEALGWQYGANTLGVTAAQFEAVIKEFDRLDPQSFTFRYTLKKDGKSSVEKGFLFSPSEFVKVIDPIIERLFCMVELSEMLVTEALEAVPD